MGLSLDTYTKTHLAARVQALTKLEQLYSQMGAT
jgi:hypothetical protein